MIFAKQSGIFHLYPVRLCLSLSAMSDLAAKRGKKSSFENGRMSDVFYISWKRTRRRFFIFHPFITLRNEALERAISPLKFQQRERKVLPF